MKEEVIEGLQKKNYVDLRGNERVKERYKAILFDLDGTLIDSMWVWGKIDEVFLGAYGIEPPEDIESILEGMSFTETATYFKEQFQIPESVEEIKGMWNRQAWDFYMTEVPLKKGVQDFLEYLKSNGIKMGIATSNSRELVTAVLEQLGIKEYFHSVRTSCEVEKGKPHPYIYLKVAEDLQVKPQECLVFEDVPNGVRAGKNAGMDVWAVEDRQHDSMREVLREIADHMIADYNEVISLFEGA